MPKEISNRDTDGVQDPYSALTPNLTVLDNIGEVARIHGGGTKEEVEGRVRELVDLVHLRDEIMSKYPHQLSGGQRQRVAIARALAVMPSFLILDEPFSALDVSTQAQIVNLLMELQQKLGLTYLLISHDLRLVQHMSDTIGVMYLGRLVEVLPAAAFHGCTHPYSRMLLAAVPNADPNSVSETCLCRANSRVPFIPHRVARSIPDAGLLKTSAGRSDPVCVALVPSTLRPATWQLPNRTPDVGGAPSGRFGIILVIVAVLLLATMDALLKWMVARYPVCKSFSCGT